MGFEKISVKKSKSLKDFAILAYSMQRSLLFYEPKIQICDANPSICDSDIEPIEKYLTDDEEVLTLLSDMGDVYTYVIRMKHLLYYGKSSSITIVGNLRENEKCRVKLVYENNSEGTVTIQYDAEYITASETNMILKKLMLDASENAITFQNMDS